MLSLSSTPMHELLLLHFRPPPKSGLCRPAAHCAERCALGAIVIMASVPLIDVWNMKSHSHFRKKTGRQSFILGARKHLDRCLPVCNSASRHLLMRWFGSP